MKIIEAANDKAKTMIGDELEQIESEYQIKLSTWKKRCEEISRDWPQKRQQIQADWKAECEAIKQQYEQRKKDVDENNQKIKQLYQQKVSQYEGELVKIDSQIRSLNGELASLKGLFKGKQREEIKNSISILEGKKSSLQKPILADYGKLMVNPRLVLPEQPVDSDTPILPTKPNRKEPNQIVDAEGILFDEFDKNEITHGMWVIKLGSYKGSPIYWIVLEKKDGKALLLSKYAFDAIPYNQKNVDITWEHCTLRSWLNKDFLSEALEAEKDRLCTTKITADANPEYATNPGEDTNDKIFLLSIKEVEKYLSEYDEEICYPTEYAKTKMVSLYEGNEPISYGACWWWLRSPGCDSGEAAIVFLDGSVCTRGLHVGNSEGAVRPALWINLES